jgi:hypothetical protein
MVDERIIEIGQVQHFFAKIKVATLNLTAPLFVGDHLLIKGPTTEFEQTVTSLQVDHRSIQRAESGQSVGLKFDHPAKEGDTIYRKM